MFWTITLARSQRALSLIFFFLVIISIVDYHSYSNTILNGTLIATNRREMRSTTGPKTNASKMNRAVSLSSDKINRSGSDSTACSTQLPDLNGEGNELACAPLPPNHPYHLELLHIPKTGGSALETVAAVKNVTWGLCHFMDKVMHRIPCPPHAKRALRHPVHKTPYWHLPITWLDWDFQLNASLPLNPSLFNPYSRPNVVMFAVVRDPYSRMVSQWNYKYVNLKALGYSRSNAQHMNEFLQRTLQARRNATPAMLEYFSYQGHFIPQHEYIQCNHITTQQMNIIILRHERLQADFACLMKRFGMSHLQLPSERMNAAFGKLTTANLTLESRRLIEEVYHRDFELFGYSKKSGLSYR